MQPWKPLAVLSVPCRKEDIPVDVGMPAKEIKKDYTLIYFNTLTASQDLYKYDSTEEK